MGRKSVRENKNAYQLAREEAGLTREAAAERMIFVSDDRIEKVEAGKFEPHPDEVMAMAKCYAAPELTNHYCSHECPIGREKVPEIPQKELTSIVLSLLADLNRLQEKQQELVAISADGKIQPEERESFETIRKILLSLDLNAASLGLWLEQKIADGEMES